MGSHSRCLDQKHRVWPDISILCGVHGTYLIYIDTLCVDYTVGLDSCDYGQSRHKIFSGNTAYEDNVVRRLRGSVMYLARFRVYHWPEDVLIKSESQQGGGMFQPWGNE